MSIASRIEQRRLTQYARFLAFGGAVALTVIVVRELIGWLLPADTPLYYSLSIILVHAVGIHANYLLQKRWVFGGGQTPFSFRAYTAFWLCAIIGAVTCLAISVLLRYATAAESWLGPWAASACFACGVLASSVLTFVLYRVWVFGARQA